MAWPRATPGTRQSQVSARGSFWPLAHPPEEGQRWRAMMPPWMAPPARRLPRSNTSRQGRAAGQIHHDHQQLGADDPGDEQGDGQVRDGRGGDAIQLPLSLGQGRAREEADGQQQPVGAQGEGPDFEKDRMHAGIRTDDWKLKTEG